MNISEDKSISIGYTYSAPVLGVLGTILQTHRYTYVNVFLVDEFEFNANIRPRIAGTRNVFTVRSDFLPTDL